MNNYAKAAIGTVFLALTIGGMGETMIWGVLSMFHASEFTILLGEGLGAFALVILSIPVFKLILQNERGRDAAPLVEEPEPVSRPSQSKTKQTAFV